MPAPSKFWCWLGELFLTGCLLRRIFSRGEFLINMKTLCFFRKQMEESTSHLLFACKPSYLVWMK
ncbi:hypothetical protein GLYMA_13G294767v4 [Glycine max]|nr:hypothetical protein GLYMA_13G294767v4 [Glycine max]KAH1104001.1 hypothetical protein GYH30_037761 [Glycine max]